MDVIRWSCITVNITDCRCADPMDRPLVPHDHVLVDGEAPESDEEVGEEAAPQSAPQSPSPSSGSGVQQTSGQRQPDLLHRKLRDRNLQLLRQLKAISIRPYTTAANSVSSLNEQMLLSGKMIEDVSLKLKKLSSDMRCLTVCLHHLSEIGQPVPAASSAANSSLSPS